MSPKGNIAWKVLRESMANGRQISLSHRTTSVEDPVVQKFLLRIAVRVERDPDSREDLMQEAMLHFWLQSRENPGQSLSWYLQSCKFHLQHLIARRRSLDSPARNAQRMTISIEWNEQDDPFPALQCEVDIVSEVSAREVISLLSPRLTARQKVILECLADGRGPCEIANRLNVSHVAITKQRIRIAAVASELGIAPRVTRCNSSSDVVLSSLRSEETKETP